MIATKDLLKSITKQKINRFVSVHKKWGNFHKPIKKISKKLSKKELLSLMKRISIKDRNFLLNIAKKHKSVNTFLRDRRISPAPDFSPEEAAETIGRDLSLTLECLPVKSQNPLKTKNNLPDLAEVACLIHFNEIGRILTERFDLPTKFKLLVEADIYGKLFNIPNILTVKFFSCLTRIQRELIKGDFIQLVDWGEELVKLEGFDQKMEEQKDEIIKLLENDHSEIKQEFLTIFPTIYMSIKPMGNPKDIFINYLKINNDVLTHIRESKIVTVNIMAFNRTRKLLNERTILFANNHRATLTPAVNKWAFYAIGPWNKLYPHHGMGIFDPKNNNVVVLYQRDIKQNLSKNGNFLFYSDIGVD